MTYSKLALLGLGVVVGAAAATALMTSEVPLAGTPNSAPPPAPPVPPPPQKAVRSELAQLLIDGHWDPAVASAYAAYLRERSFRGLETDLPTALVRLIGLGERSPGVMSIVQKRPEHATLLAFAPDPDELAQLIESSSEEDWQLFEGCLKQFVDRNEFGRAVGSLRAHGPLVSRLADKGLIQSERLLLIGEAAGAGDPFTSWLVPVLKTDCSGGETTDEGETAEYAFLLASARGIADRMAREPGFAKQFHSTLWPRFCELAKAHGTWDLYGSFPGIWTVLEDPEGVRLVQEYQGLAVLLLASNKGFAGDAGLKALARRLMLTNQNFQNDGLLTLMAHFSDDTNFRNVLRKGLSDYVLRNWAGELLGKYYPSDPALPFGSDGYESRVRENAQAVKALIEEQAKNGAAYFDRYYADEKDHVIIRNIPILYSAVYVPLRRLSDDRALTTEEWIDFGADVVSLIPVGGAGARAATSVAGAGAKTAAASAAKKQLSGKLLKAVSGQRLAGAARKPLANSADDVAARLLSAGKLSPHARSLGTGLALRAGQDVVRKSGAHGVRSLATFSALAGKQTGVGVRSARLLDRLAPELCLIGRNLLLGALPDTSLHAVLRRSGVVLAKQVLRELLESEPDPVRLRKVWADNSHDWWLQQLTMSD